VLLRRLARNVCIDQPVHNFSLFASFPSFAPSKPDADKAAVTTRLLRQPLASRVTLTCRTIPPSASSVKSPADYLRSWHVQALGQNAASGEWLSCLANDPVGCNRLVPSSGDTCRPRAISESENGAAQLEFPRLSESDSCSASTMSLQVLSVLCNPADSEHICLARQARCFITSLGRRPILTASKRALQARLTSGGACFSPSHSIRAD
jgi:hypothetical protein